jgi:hypothetical protein
MFSSLCNLAKKVFPLLLLAVGTASGQVNISPASAPVVNQGDTFHFTADVPVVWSCNNCKGSIESSTGVYTAPNVVTAQQSYGGYQLLPNNHVYNTPIDSLPVHLKSAAWIGGAGTVPLSFAPSVPINYVDGSTPTQSMGFFYTPAKNGPFAILPYPRARIESGWFAPLWTFDRHFFAIDTATGTFQEMYNYYSAGSAATIEGCSTCTSQSGIRYPNYTYNLPDGGNATDAAGMYFMPLTLRLQEMQQALATGGTINHALRYTLNLGYCASSHIWPATNHANDGGTVPFGARFRLKANFDISSFSVISKILLTQLKQYGIILADGGTGWQVTTEYTKWPAAYLAAFEEIRKAAIAPTDFEAIDESNIEVSPSSGLTTTAETVTATTVDGRSSTRQVVLTGVTVGLPKDKIYFQAAASALQLEAFVHGSSNTAVTWSMNPSVGTLTSGGLYTPPSSIGSATATAVTATSSANGSVTASMTIVVLPVVSGSTYLVLGRSDPYTDSHGNVWQPGQGDDGCFPSNAGGSWSGIDITLYEISCYASNDIRFDIYVPNGRYTVTGKFAAPGSECGGLGGHTMNIEAQGRVYTTNFDPYAAAGNACNTPADNTISDINVNNGLLSYVLRFTGGDYSLISAVQISSETTSTNEILPPTALKAIVE